MRPVFTALLAILIPASAQADVSRLDPKNTYAVIVGVLEWEQGTLTEYKNEARQDVALGKQLLQLGVPESQIVLLLDKDATRAAIAAAITKTAKQAGQDSTLIVYYAGHGMKHESEGVFACYDIRTKAMETTGWRHSDVTKTIKEHFRGDHVLLLADCCFSGTLENVAKELSEHGIAAASITSASAWNLSTNNWTYTCAVVNIFAGSALADTNTDGVITVTEAAAEVREAINVYERQRSGFAIHGLPVDFQLTRVKVDDPKRADDKNFGDFQRGQYVSARRADRWTNARVLDASPSDAGQHRLLVRFQDYNAQPELWVLASDVRQINQPKLQVKPPDPIEAEQALAKASIDGKLTKLLAKIYVPNDVQPYGAFRDYGPYQSDSYSGYRDLPIGYWVYVYPHWYIWENVVREQEIDEPIVAPDQMVMIGDPFAAPAINRPEIPNAIPPYDAKQMVGKPDTPEAGDYATCWAAETMDQQKVWLELDYDVTAPVSAMHIYENCAPGAVYQITGVENNQEVLLWQGVDPTPPGAAKGISKIPLQTDRVFKRFRIYLNCKIVTGWNEVDAVGVIDQNNKTHWAVDARASSVYTQNMNIEFVDPFQNEQDRITERIAELTAEIRKRKDHVRELSDAIDSENAVIKKLYEELADVTN